MTLIASLSVPHYKQEQSNSCLPACVRMVLAHYGRTHSEDELRQLLGTGPGGTPAGRVSQVASLGFDVDLRPLSPSDLVAVLQSGVPPILLLDTDALDYWSIDCYHTAILVGLDLTTAYLNDPAFDTTPQQTSLTGLDRAWGANKYYTALIRPRP